jgi:hypothetical protein
MDELTGQTLYLIFRIGASYENTIMDDWDDLEVGVQAAWNYTAKYIRENI